LKSVGKGVLKLALLPFTATAGCLDFTLRLVGLRRRRRPKLREILVRNSEKDGEKLHLNCIWPCETIILKKKLQAFVGIRADNQRLVYCGRILKDDEVIPDECFKLDPKDDSEMVFHIWMINVGFSMNKYTAMKAKEDRLQSGVSGAKIVPDDTLGMEGETEEERIAREKDEEIAWEVKECVKHLVAQVEQKVIDEQIDNEDPAEKHRRDRFDITKELELIGCSEYVAGLKQIGFGERGAFSFLKDEHLIGYPLFVHNKARKKMVGLAAAYRRQLQYEEQQLKTHLTKMNEISFSKKYTTDGKEFFHSKAEMDAFYKQIEDEKREEKRRNSKQDIRNKFMKVRRGFNFMSLAQNEPKAREHSEIVEEKIDRITKYNARDEWDLPSRASIHKGYMEQKYINQKQHEDETLNKEKAAQWAGEIQERLIAADAFENGHVAIHDLRRILTQILTREHVHNPEEKTEEILRRADIDGSHIHHDHKIIVEFAVDIMLNSLRKHISGEMIRAQKHRLEEEAAKKRRQHYWLHLEEDAEEERQREIKKITPFNCPGFTPQPFDRRRCIHCKFDRTLHTIIHTKKDYEAILAQRNQDVMNENMKLSAANEIVARQEEVKRKLREQLGALGGVKMDWEDV